MIAVNKFWIAWKFVGRSFRARSFHAWKLLPKHCRNRPWDDQCTIGVWSRPPPPDTTSLLTWDFVCFFDRPLGKCKRWPQWQQNLKPPIGGWDASFWNLNPNKNSTPCMREICYILLTAFWCLAEWEFVANDSCFPHWGVSFEFSNREAWFQTSKAKTGSQQKGAVWVFFRLWKVAIVWRFSSNKRVEKNLGWMTICGTNVIQCTQRISIESCEERLTALDLLNSWVLNLWSLSFWTTVVRFDQCVLFQGTYSSIYLY